MGFMESVRSKVFRYECTHVHLSLQFFFIKVFEIIERIV